VRTLTSLDERPKLVLGLGRSEVSARQAGLLREDLHYRLRMGLLNLDAPGLREAIVTRRSQPPRRPAPPSRPPTSRMPSPPRVVAKAKARPAQRSRAVPRVKSARTVKATKKPRPAKKRSKRR